MKVALSGDGADELFGSYLSHRLAAELDYPDAEWREKLHVFTDVEKRALYFSGYRGDRPEECEHVEHLGSSTPG